MKIKALIITPEILSLIASIDEFNGTWRVLGNLAPEQLTSLRRVATIESIGSSTRIEGSKLTDRQVESLLSNLEIQKFENRDEQEVAGYAAVMIPFLKTTGKFHLPRIIYVSFIGTY